MYIVYFIKGSEIVVYHIILAIETIFIFFTVIGPYSPVVCYIGFSACKWSAKENIPARGSFSPTPLLST